MNNYNNYSSYGNYNYPNSFNTNIVLVTSLEEALYRTNMNNSDMVYFHQTDRVFYRVKVDARGEKTWQTISYGPVESDVNTPVTRGDLQAIEERLRKLEGKEAPNEQSDG